VKLGPLHHIAIAVSRIEEALPFYRDTLGFTAEQVHDLADQHVRVVFLGDKNQRIELVQPTDGESGVVCYVVDDLAGTLRRLQSEGIELVDRAPRRGAEGMVAFIHPRASGGVLIELIDRASLRDSIP